MVGWAMQGASFLFLDRKWEHDEAYLDVILNYFKSLYYKSHVSSTHYLDI